MKFELLLNRILQLPLDKAMKLFEDYQKQEEFKNFYEQQRVLDLIAHKLNLQSQIKKEVFQEAYLCLSFMANDYSPWSKKAFETMKKYPMIVWIECIGMLNSQNIMDLLHHYHKELPFSLIQTCIINLPQTMQLKAIDTYKSQINSKEPLFSNFYYSVGNEARSKLKEYFPDQIEDDILLELRDLDESIVYEKLSREHKRLMNVSADDLIEFILLKSYKLETLNRFLELFSDKVMDCSIPKFKLLFTRYKYLCNYRGYAFDIDEEEQSKSLTDMDLFQLFKNKFHQMGIKETLSLFDHRAYYGINHFAVDVVFEFLDIAYSGSDLSEYVNDETISEIITRFVETCKNKKYSKEDLKQFVENLGKDGKTKLVFDDFIEAIIACGNLLKDRVINDQDPLFLELRTKFSQDLLGRCKKDGTYQKTISLNGLFYRLAKGRVPFDKVYLTKTYKGLIYISKCTQFIDHADYITHFLTDEQLAKLNITPVKRWKNAICRTNTSADHVAFIERMGLQLFCYFGIEKGKYLLEANMQGNRMENLFDRLSYETISIEENGEPNVNEELIHYLFGYGPIKEIHSVMNQLIRGDIPEFERYFPEFCNSFEEIKQACNGVLSSRRIVKYFEDVALPIELKPDELEFKPALKEINTLDPTLLSIAIELCKDARNREYSSIPKVEGQLGDFTYKILDLKDSLAVAVGYLSHCCFVINGISYSSFKHSMKSNNGRTFVVYYKGYFLTQSWVWRNGDVICFDSVEAGSPCHGMYKDEVKLVDVYKKAARQMLFISNEVEDDMQKVKVVTVGKSDYVFDGLERVTIDVPRPLETGTYVGDSAVQYILAGNISKKLRYGAVGVQYRDPRKKVVSIDDVNKVDIDLLDEVVLNINSLRYQIKGEQSPINCADYKKILSGDGWFLLVKKDGSIESGYLAGNESAKNEYDQYLSKYTESKPTFFHNGEPVVRRLELTCKRR